MMAFSCSAMGVTPLSATAPSIVANSSKLAGQLSMGSTPALVSSSAL